MRAETVGSVENISRDLNVFVYKWKGRDRKWPKESIFFSSPETLSFLIWKRLEFLANVNTLWVFSY